MITLVIVSAFMRFFIYIPSENADTSNEKEEIDVEFIFIKNTI